MYVIRTAFWLSVVILLLPADTDDHAEQIEQSQNERVSAGETIGAAISAAGDIAGLCARQPEVCETGSAAWQTFQNKARYGFELLYNWAGGDEPTDEDGEATEGGQTNASNNAGLPRAIVVSENTAPLHTGSADTRRITPAAGGNDAKSQNTLKIEDLIPQWKGPGKNTRA
jgi:hypothetical protein